LQRGRFAAIHRAMTIPAPDPAAAAGEQRAVLRGLAMVLVAMLILPGQDAAAKYISDVVSPGQIVFARFLLQTLFTLPFLVWLQGWRGLRPNRLGANVLRGALITAASLMFFTALKVMPMADALAIFFVEPFILTVLSAVIDKEKVGWRRQVAVAAGFIGVLIVVRPSYDVFGAVSLLPAAGGFLFAIYVLMNRRQAAHDSPLAMQFTAGLSALLIMSVVLAAGWSIGLPELSPSPVGAREIGFLLLMGALGTAGHLCFVEAGRLAPSSLIAPLQYVEIVCAALIGYLVFGDFPDFWKWVGIAIIVASGAYVFWREASLRGG
jgi:drug/metabolite transporter (DMT)-like permease